MHYLVYQTTNAINGKIYNPGTLETKCVPAGKVELFTTSGWVPGRGRKIT